MSLASGRSPSISQQSTRSSIFSGGAESLASLDSDEDVQTQIEGLANSSEQVARENAMFLAYLQRHAPKLAEMEFEESTQKKHRKRRASRAAPVLLSAEQKLEIAMREVEFTRNEIVRAERTGERLLDHLKAIREETEARIMELKKDAFEFKKEIVLGSQNPRTGKILGERVEKYMRDKIKEKDALVDNLKLKNQMLAVQIKKMQQQLKEKEELGEGLSQIDFDQLKIENKQYYDKIHERNQELLRLKLTAGNTIQMLNTFKRKLQHLVSEAEWLRTEIKTKEEFLTKTTEETGIVASERDRYVKQHDMMTQRISATKVPAVLDYVNQKAHLFDLEKKLKDYQRKVEIAQMELKRVARVAQQQQQ
eukprot:TRINITY_DN5874_c0_g1_i1.p1 TRINITY_DN5874_c0_g1~~TRINITY_DN5874_c0_g1_i1.p1  ORF type:complete len:365 (-),score=76.85 TRINITY_DN5874_c0_g1_i1:53-1147(-)